MLTKMKYVYEVYKTGSFSKAAKNLYISQPALSTAVSSIEKSLGIKIFNRSSIPMTLTETGAAYIDAIEKILDIEYGFKNRLLELENLQFGHLNVGGANFFSSYMLPPIIKAFSRTYPGISFEIIESDSIKLYEDIQTKHIDLILDAGEYDASLFTAHHLLSEQILLGIPIENPINAKFAGCQLSYLDIIHSRHKNKKECINLAELQEEKFILLNRGHDLYNRSIAICSHNQFQPENVLFLNQLMTAYNLAVQGIGLVFVTDTLVKLAPFQERLVYYRIQDPAAARDIFLAHRNILTPTKAMEKFIELSRKIYADI